MSQKPARKQLEENVQQAVEGAKEEITAARRPWYEAIHWGFILIGVYSVQLTLFALLALWVHIHPILGVIKLLVARPRPKAPLVEILQVVNGQSFPSGHVMSYLAYFGLLFSLGIILFRGKRWWRMVLLIIPAFFVVMVGPSRIYLGAHWASDVLGAYLIGGVLLGIALWLYLRLKKKGVLAAKGRGEKPA